MDRNLVIGDEKGIPWRLPADLKRFRKVTLGKPIIMGRTTFEHIGRPLDQRTNIVLTRSKRSNADGVLYASSFAEALTLAGDVPEVAVIGGGQVYRDSLSIVSRLYLTFVDGDFAGNVHFPDAISTPAGHKWVVTSGERFEADEKNPVAHKYVVLDRRPAPDEPESTLLIRNLMSESSSQK